MVRRLSVAMETGSIQASYFREPLLEFGDGGLHVDPKSGIARYGPKSKGTGRHPRNLRVGFIGTAATIQQARDWIEENVDGITGNENHPEFPGYAHDRGFFSELSFDDRFDEKLTMTELRPILEKGRRQRDRLEETVDLLDGKLQLLSERDLAPQYIVMALPDDLVKRCRVADYNDNRLGRVHRDLRRAVKARAMRYRIPLQILIEPTMDGRDKTPRSKIAWNFMTGLYFKAGGVPWGPTGLEPGSCYIGISFYRLLGGRRQTMQTSLVQAFDEHGEGLVLRGHEFEWDEAKEGTKSPHLSGDQAAQLVDMVLKRYEQEIKQRPRRVVVHKRSRFWPDEREGFEQALSGRVSRYDLMALQPQNTARLLPVSKYPPLRGTRFSVGEIDYLYTTGYLAPLREFHAMHVPSPLQVADHIGQDTASDDLLKEVLTLTKMNWNSASYGGLLPITLKFSQLVGDILREMPEELEPLPQFKFYM